MKETILKKIRIFLRESKLHRRLIAVLLCFATLVSSGTLAMIMLTGVTMTKAETFCCPYAQHEHSDECFTDDGLYQCAYATAHMHDETCYDAEGTLLCTLPQIEPHTHDAACFETVQELTCETEEGFEGHVHTEECYTETQILTCPLQELPVHVHTSECFTQAATEGEAESEATGEAFVSDPNAPADVSNHYVLNQNGSNGMPELSVKNRHYTLRFDKQDGETHELLPGVTFTLHREVTVFGITDIDFAPIPGYEALVSDQNGVIPLLDQTLPQGTYYLEETATVEGYVKMVGYLRFTVGPKGEVEILTEGREDWLTKYVNQEGDTVVYTLAVPNVRKKTHITLQKVGYDNTQTPLREYPVTGAVFNIYESDGTTLLTVNGVVQSNITDSGNGIFFEGDLLPGSYYIEEVTPPTAYQPLPGRLLLTIDSTGATLQGTWTTSDPNHSVGTTTGNLNTGYLMTVRNASGVELPATGGVGVWVYYTIGAYLLTLAAIMLRRRKKYA